MSSSPPLKLFSVVIPARDEQDSLPLTLAQITEEFRREGVPHEIIVVDDGSKDRTRAVLQELRAQIPELRPLQNDTGEHGFGRAIGFGFRHMTGDATVIMMADSSDDARAAVRYWRRLNEGWDCVFGGRFIKGGSCMTIRA